MKKLILGTRGSPLALIQTRSVAALLRARFPDLVVEEKIIVTDGDNQLDRSLVNMGGKGAFTEALEAELLNGQVDGAVHSCKDLPTLLPEGLALSAVPSRAPVEDVLITKPGLTLFTLPEGSRVATGSLRRQILLKRLRPDLIIRDIRGNVGTRLAKLDDGVADALILARAGLERLQLSERITEVLDAELFLPAVGQGALAIETRTGDERVIELLRACADMETDRLCIMAERALLSSLGGGCQLSLGVISKCISGQLILRAQLISPDGLDCLDVTEEGLLAEAEAIGRLAGKALLQAGGKAILAAFENRGGVA
ncbi:MAG: hydroxymethylbilane synthase [Elusimicrobia bacterium RIFOXYB2_FULL_49_7]|nr:MAG: hydroxymethylbilane synthase [Elusimicrobia bacterium RIFOXYB2_FULL_49_7]